MLSYVSMSISSPALSQELFVSRWHASHAHNRSIVSPCSFWMPTPLPLSLVCSFLIFSSHLHLVHPNLFFYPLRCAILVCWTLIRNITYHSVSGCNNTAAAAALFYCAVRIDCTNLRFHDIGIEIMYLFIRRRHP